MSLTDIVRSIAKNVRQTVSDPGELKEKAKDLPLNVLQTALTGVGQALTLSDRVRTRLRNIVGDRDTDVSAPAPGDRDSAWATATEEAPERDKPARREPVIFAPRPSPAPTGAPSNGATKPAATTTPEPTTVAEPASTVAEPAATVTEPSATVTETEPVAAPAEAVVTPAEPVTAPAEPVVTPAEAVVTPKAKPAAAKPATTRKKPATPRAKAAPKAKQAATESGAALAEPLAGYAEMTVASLRARMRGKSVDQMRALLEYEQSTTARPEVVQMFARRLAKLESGE
ncbi:hypothetical protein [Sphaerisporangium aureirubrum]|uniref:Lipid droplet-associated protein n=1 Tax=Sphaerisporangium aureirubrum TaxID=1544736 RepID=A0ABW1NG33_9ACTN